MAITKSTYPDPYSDTPLSNVVAWIETLNCDFNTMRGSVSVAVNKDVSAMNSGKPPIDRVTFSLGNELPSLTEMMTDNPSLFAELQAYIESKLVLTEAFNGATSV